MTEIDLREALAFASALAADASNMIRSTRPQRVTTKDNPADLVTEVDVAIERHTRDAISARYPDHGVDGEELGAPAKGTAFTWYLDPIDGTTNYVNGLPWSSFSLALADADGPLLGVVADPYRHEVVTAARGLGATVDGVKVRCSDATELAGTTILTEWSGHSPWPGMHKTIDEIVGAYGTIRIMGSSALAITAVALGRASVAIIGNCHAVDDMAGTLIAQEAGARIGGRHAAEPGPDGILVATPKVFEQARALWQ